MVDISHPWTYPDVARAVIRRRTHLLREGNAPLFLKQARENSLNIAKGEFARCIFFWHHCTGHSKVEPMSKNRWAASTVVTDLGAVSNMIGPQNGWLQVKKKDRPVPVWYFEGVASQMRAGNKASPDEDGK